MGSGSDAFYPDGEFGLSLSNRSASAGSLGSIGGSIGGGVGSPMASSEGEEDENVVALLLAQLMANQSSKEKKKRAKKIKDAVVGAGKAVEAYLGQWVEGTQSAAHDLEKNIANRLSDLKATSSALMKDMSLELSRCESEARITDSLVLRLQASAKTLSNQSHKLLRDTKRSDDANRQGVEQLRARYMDEFRGGLKQSKAASGQRAKKSKRLIDALKSI